MNVPAALPKAISQRVRPFGLEAPRQRSKYNNVKTIVDGITFDSKREAARFGELKLLEKAGFIRNLELQPKFEFKLSSDGPVLFRYIADFRYFESATRVVEDIKGMETAVFKLKKRLIEAAFNVKIQIVK